MKKGSSLLQMFGESAGQVERDMNKIVGKTATPGPDLSLPDLSPAEVQQMTTLVVLSGRDGFSQVQRNIMEFLIKRYVANGHPDPRTPATPPGDGSTPVAGSMLDLSSPLNTIVKSIFFLSLSPMFAGTIHFYFISVVCSGAIIYSLNKIIKS